MSRPGGALRRLARLYGVQPEYRDIEGRPRGAEEAPLLEVLRALGAPVERPGDVAFALRRRRAELWRRGIPPVTVAWNGRLPALLLRRPAEAGGLEFAMRLEGDGEDGWTPIAARVDAVGGTRVEGIAYRRDRVVPDGVVRPGYHRLRARCGDRAWETLVVSAPARAYGGGGEDPPRRVWGVFQPLYGLRTERGWGTGDLGSLAALARWVAERGGAVVGTLPLLASFLEEPLEPSPYAPVSRLFWNELYADLTGAAELDACPAARALLSGKALQEGIVAARESRVVDYAAEHARRRPVLDLLAGCFFEAGGESSAEYDGFLRAYPEAERYATFRAIVERRREPWRAWPEALRRGEMPAGEYEDAARRRHLYAQLLMHRQLGATSRAAAEQGVGLYLDLPLGAHPDGYDAWAHRRLFAAGMSAGAPPDPFISKGQSWGFAPPRPAAMRTSGYAYTIAALRTHMRYAAALRLDHVMSLHRLFWVPHGREPAEGVYVRYRPDELYAILSLESHRHGTVVIGEDLGTVPASVRRAMGRHGVRRMYVAQFEFGTDATAAPARVPPDAVASLNTHDMPPFAAFWRGDDITDRQSLGWLDGAAAEEERKRRSAQRESLLAWLLREGRLGGEKDAGAVLAALLGWLGESDAEIVVVALEDLWLETRPQNVPGTWRERPNWRGRAAHRLEEAGAVEGVEARLRRLREGRVRRRLAAERPVEEGGGGGGLEVGSPPRGRPRRIVGKGPGEGGDGFESREPGNEDGEGAACGAGAGRARRRARRGRAAECGTTHRC